MDGRVLIVKFHPDGKTRLTGTASGRVAFWDVATRRKRSDVVRQEGAVYAAAFDPDGRVIAIAAGDMAARLDEGWNPPPVRFALDALRPGLQRGVSAHFGPTALDRERRWHRAALEYGDGPTRRQDRAPPRPGVGRRV